MHSVHAAAALVMYLADRKEGCYNYPDAIYQVHEQAAWCSDDQGIFEYDQWQEVDSKQLMTCLRCAC